jgi:GT2 family glycosyltransferase
VKAAQITAVICTYRRSEVLQDALASLSDQSLEAGQYEILVVENAPGGTSASDGLSQLFPKARWLQAPSVGLSNARNLAISTCNTPLIAFLDDDAVASRGWLTSFVCAFEEFGHQVFAAGGRVEPLWLALRPPWLPEELLGHFSLVDWGGERRLLGSRQWIAGTNMAFRVAELNRISGFSTKFGRCGGEQILLSNEENDVVSRLKEQGGEVLYVPDAAVQHLIPPERLTQSWMRRRVVWQAISDYMQRPQEMFGKARGHWNAVERFNAGLRPEYQTMNVLLVEQSDPDVFRRQMAALYSYTMALLTGFHGIGA